MDSATISQVRPSMQQQASLLSRLPWQRYEATAAARQLIDTNRDGKISPQELKTGLQRDQVSLDPKTRQIIANRSKIAIATDIFPKDHSATFDTVEQCMEFAMRYFKEDRAKAGLSGSSFDHDFGSQHDLADEVRRMIKGDLKKPGYNAYANGDITPPRAGDILVGESPSGDEFHVALITEVLKKDGNWEATVYQANVPYNTNSHNLADHVEQIPLSHKDGKWQLEQLPTSKFSYQEDMDVVGWIHPSPAKALPEAADSEVIAQGQGAQKQQ